MSYDYNGHDGLRKPKQVHIVEQQESIEEWYFRE